MKALSAFLLALSTFASLTQAEDAPKQRPGAGGAGGDYREKMQQLALQKFDANKNGVLDPDEKAAAMKAMQERKGKAGRPSFTPGTATDSGTSKFRRPPEAPKQGDATK